MTPVAVFAYSRPAHTAAALDALARCDRLGECRVHVFCDGPRGPESAAAVAATRAVVGEWAGTLGAEVVARDENLGLARSIVSGVTDLCGRYGRAIVLEDDLVVAPDFLDFMLRALDRYESEPGVWQVSGFAFPLDGGGDADASFLPMPSTWGWATWGRAWAKADWSASGAPAALEDGATRRRFDLDGAYPYSGMLADRLAGRNDSWGIVWWWSIFRAGGVVLYPSRSLVRVGGWDGSGTHGGKSTPFPQEPVGRFSTRRFEAPARLPASVAVDGAAYDAVKRFLRSHGPTGPSLWGRARTGLRRLLGAARGLG